MNPTDERIAHVMSETARINKDGTLQEWIATTAKRCDCTEQQVGQAIGRIAHAVKKERDTFVICHNGSPLVIVRNTEFKLPTDVLQWYADNYAFERSKLSWAAIREVEMP